MELFLVRWITFRLAIDILGTRLLIDMIPASVDHFVVLARTEDIDDDEEHGDHVDDHQDIAHAHHDPSALLRFLSVLRELQGCRSISYRNTVTGSFVGELGRSHYIAWIA